MATLYPLLSLVLSELDYTPYSHWFVNGYTIPLTLIGSFGAKLYPLLPLVRSMSRLYPLIPSLR
jgi:hypothetical protein